MRRPSLALLAAFGPALLLTAPGCAATPEESARTVTTRYLKLLTHRPQRGRDGLEAAYGLLARDFQASCDLACFRARVAQDRPAAADALPRVADAALELYATPAPAKRGDRPADKPPPAPTPGDKAADPPEARPRPEPRLDLPPEALALPPLRSGAAGWRFTQNPLDFYPQDTPGRCLRSFLAALSARRYGVLLRFLPRAARASRTAESLRQQLSGPAGEKLWSQAELARRHLGEPFQLEGNDALLPVGERRAVRLTLEPADPADPASRSTGARWVVSALQ